MICFLFLIQTGGLCFASTDDIITVDPKLYQVPFTVKALFCFYGYLNSLQDNLIYNLNYKILYYQAKFITYVFYSLLLE